MSNNETEDVFNGRGPSEGLRWITIRGALALEINHPRMKRSSRGRATIVLANEITKIKTRDKRVAYEALNDHIVRILGPEKDRPL
jgi:hypothetical protein